MFSIRKILASEAKNELNKVGFDNSYLEKGVKKYQFKLLKISPLTPPQATILKQTALSVGADCALHRDVLTHSIEKSSAILAGSISQLNKIAQKLHGQPFSMGEISKLIMANLQSEKKSMTIRNKTFNWGAECYLMGILNVTPDSFSDGGKFFSIENALTQAQKLITDGADIIDIGGESTRPFSEKVEITEEIQRVIPIIKELRVQFKDIPISIDTRNAKTALMAVEAGADMLNDVSGFDYDKKMINTVADLACPVILMHSKNTPDKMQLDTSYDDVMDEVYNSLKSKLEKAQNAGINDIILDVGIGFGKTIEQNYELVRRMREFNSLKTPILAGVSRKSFIYKTLEINPEESDEASTLLHFYLAQQGANILRVHDVARAKQMLKLHKKMERHCEGFSPKQPSKV